MTEKQPVRVKFLQRHGAFNKGEIGGYTEAQAAKLIAEKKGVYVDRPMPVEAPAAAETVEGGGFQLPENWTEPDWRDENHLRRIALAKAWAKELGHEFDSLTADQADEIIEFGLDGELRELLDEMAKEAAEEAKRKAEEEANAGEGDNGQATGEGDEQNGGDGQTDEEENSEGGEGQQPTGTA